MFPQGREEQLTEELSGSKSREVQLEKTMEAEIKHLQRETESLMEQHRNEVWLPCHL